MADQVEPVHFFDVKCSLEGHRQSWSPNTLKVRGVLNLKGIPYTQSWISYPDIAPLSEALEIPIDAGNPNFPGILYTLPVIIHKPSVTINPNGAMHDSLQIALHLERTFPAPKYPSVFPHGQTSVTLALATEKLFHSVIAKCSTLIFPGVAGILDGRGTEYFERTRVPNFQREYSHITKMADLKPKTKEEFDKVVEETKRALAVFDELFAAGGENKGPFLEGEKPGFADVMFAAYMAWIERPLPGFFETILDAGNGSVRRHWGAMQAFVNGQGETKDWPVTKIEL